MKQQMVHTCYRVKNLEESIKFYTEAFDFKVSRLRDFPENQFTLAYLTLPESDYELELTYNYGHGAYELGTGYGHIAIAVEDLEALHEQQKNAGYNVTDLKGLPGIPPSYYFIIDPDGYKVEVVRMK
ncbi:lactoylglutathione lyase [Granulicatella sp. zg-ZJ]|uniref:lactoylglutathione lyase n=1 Tax=unclassified Granulicatella TaxID=2630493 RepID=UPI0013C09706|nr:MULTISPECIES: VOC family protein [unclassified Granulicatella]MBS4749652.1 VOC family protein [Carnobacteriaceae bacterium zg-ZUI78]NEW61781.1 lactoylglutathione lyase [Granulicatella sp. zg-ZJ]NEW66375.1 lactoylglutathione lyase [Granulicatella sp. zg-84]QMI86452.1 VOC family protein [Carnobacteriaceae bacterium zg-84]